MLSDTQARLPDPLTTCGLSSKEQQAWQDNEPDFAKRIVTTINSKRTKRRSDVTCRNNIYIEVLLKVTNRTYAR